LASAQNKSPEPRLSTPENKKILQLYVERFNRRDWDGLRELISADARLLVADRFSGRLADAGYLSVSSRRRMGKLQGTSSSM
jgi:RNA polymerase sigma-70 factor (ECF subfamily)